MNFQDAAIRPGYQVAEAENAALRSVFSWMTAGLLCTGLVASYVINTPAMMRFFFGTPGLIWGLIIAELGLVFWLSARVMQMSAGKATGIFLGYSALNGITLAPIAFIYTGASISSAFITAAGMFAGMALYGYVTKRDLSGWGSFLFMGMCGVFLAFLINIFTQSDTVSFVASVVGVIVFTGLTAYDVQDIKRMGSHIREGDSHYRQWAILGALRLYLDLINLFIMLLNLMGDRD